MRVDLINLTRCTMRTLKLLFPTVILLILTATLKGQEVPDTVSIWDIETVDNNDFIGIIVKQDENSVTIRTDILGEVTILRSKIKTISKIESQQIKDGEYWFENPHSTRYFYGPNGYGLKAQEAYYQNTWVLFNQVSWGISDYFSFGVGMMPLFLFGGAPTPVWITPKVSIPLKKDKLNIGGGIMAATVLGESIGSFGIGYSVISVGSRDKNATFGMGLGFSGQNGFSNVPTFLFSGMTRVSRRGYLLTENYYIRIFDESLGIISFGGRTVRKKLAIDFGLIIPVAEYMGFVAIPWLGITMPFGNGSSSGL